MPKPTIAAAKAFGLLKGAIALALVRDRVFVDNDYFDNRSNFRIGLSNVAAEGVSSVQ